MSRINIAAHLFIDNLYSIIVASAIITMLFGITGFTSAIYLLFVLIGISVFFDRKTKVLDSIVLFFILYSLSSYFFNGDYPFKLYIESIRDQIAPIFFYFIARSNSFRNCQMLKKMIYPLGFAYVAGLYFYFFQPSWYMAFKLDNKDMVSVLSYYEIMRLSSFWWHSYFVGYSSLFVIIYILNQRFYNGVVRKYYNPILIVAFLAIIFAQQRVSIAFLLLYLVGLYVILVKKKIISFTKSVPYLVLFSIIFFSLGIYLFNSLDQDLVNYIVQRSIEKEDNLIEERTQMFDSYINTISFWGSGLGKYSHNALKYDMDSITDCEYIRLPNELGIFGMSTFFIIIIVSYISLFKRKNFYCFEMLIISFVLVAMIGATPLEVTAQQPYLLWYCIGRTQMRLYYDRC